MYKIRQVKCAWLAVRTGWAAPARCETNQFESPDAVRDGIWRLPKMGDLLKYLQDPMKMADKYWVVPS